MVQSKNIEDGLVTEDEFPEFESLGALLRTERQKKGITHEQIFEMTRVRPDILAALENEDWEHLPSSAFIKGFLRSYSQALKIDEGRVLELFEESAQVHREPPQLPQKGNDRSWWRLPLLLAAVILCGASGIYLWESLKPQDRQPVAASVNTTDSGSTEVTAEGSRPKKAAEVESETSEPRFMDHEAVAPAPPAPAPEETFSKQSEPPHLETETTSVEASPSSLQEAAQGVTPTVPPVDFEYILKGDVRERTWVKITVDGEDPKEYIFEPGSRPEWEAKKGFDLLVGNAAGIELEFNGKKMAPLGAPGQVVRLRLPRDYENRSVQN